MDELRGSTEFRSQRRDPLTGRQEMNKKTIPFDANSEVIRFNLNEAHEELTRILTQVTEGRCDPAEFIVGLAHCYHHLNTAWNSRGIDSLADPRLIEGFHDFREFPTDLTSRHYPDEFYSLGKDDE